MEVLNVQVQDINENRMNINNENQIITFEDPSYNEGENQNSEEQFINDLKKLSSEINKDLGSDKLDNAIKYTIFLFYLIFNGFAVYSSLDIVKVIASLTGISTQEAKEIKNSIISLSSNLTNLSEFYDNKIKKPRLIYTVDYYFPNGIFDERIVWRCAVNNSSQEYEENSEKFNKDALNVTSYASDFLGDVSDKFTKHDLGEIAVKNFILFLIGILILYPLHNLQDYRQSIKKDLLESSMQRVVDFLIKYKEYLNIQQNAIDDFKLKEGVKDVTNFTKERRKYIIYENIVSGLLCIILPIVSPLILQQFDMKEKESEQSVKIASAYGVFALEFFIMIYRNILLKRYFKGTELQSKACECCKNLHEIISAVKIQNINNEVMLEEFKKIEEQLKETENQFSLNEQQKIDKSLIGKFQRLAIRLLYLPGEIVYKSLLLPKNLYERISEKCRRQKNNNKEKTSQQKIDEEVKEEKGDNGKTVLNYGNGLVIDAATGEKVEDKKNIPFSSSLQQQKEITIKKSQQNKGDVNQKNFTGKNETSKEGDFDKNKGCNLI